MQRDEREYVLIDTAGVRKRGKITDVVEKFSAIKTLQAIEDANVVLLVIDAREGISDQDLSLLGFILNSGRSLVIVVNKWDGLSQEVKEQVKETLDYRLGFIDFARVHFISALHGSGVGNLFESVREAYDSATRRVSTAMLTRIMNMAAEDHQPPLVRGRRVKLKYAHAGGYNPPIVVIHGNQVKDLPDSYKRYLMNYFRKSLDVMGTPIRIQFKEGENPFANKRNTLTPNQMRKRKRLIKHIKKSNQQDLPTNMNPSKPALPGFFIKGDCSDATTRMIGMYICTYPMRFLICQLRLLKQLFEYAMIIYTQKVIAMIREKTHLDISEKIHGVALL